jgi:hypothetical protein
MRLRERWSHLRHSIEIMLWSIATDLSFESALTIKRRMKMLWEMVVVVLLCGMVGDRVLTGVTVRGEVGMEDISL